MNQWGFSWRGEYLKTVRHSSSDCAQQAVLTAQLRFQLRAIGVAKLADDLWPGRAPQTGARAMKYAREYPSILSRLPPDANTFETHGRKQRHREEETTQTVSQVMVCWEVFSLAII